MVILLTAGVFAFTTLILVGCAQPKATVGLRVFQEAPRFHDDNLTVQLLDPESEQVILSCPLKMSYWWPVEIHELQPDRALIFELKYDGMVEGEQYIQNKTYRQTLPMETDTDLTIWWEPYHRIADDAAEDNLANWSREPRAVPKEGHRPVF